jgi:hypothetical protein
MVSVLDSRTWCCYSVDSGTSVVRLSRAPASSGQADAEDREEKTQSGYKVIRTDRLPVVDLQIQMPLPPEGMDKFLQEHARRDGVVVSNRKLNWYGSIVSPFTSMSKLFGINGRNIHVPIPC